MINSTIEEQPDPVGKPFPKLMINGFSTVIIAYNSTDYTVLSCPTNLPHVGKQFSGQSLTGYVDLVGQMVIENE